MKGLLLIFVLTATGCNSQQSKNPIDKSALPLIETFFRNIESKKAIDALSQLLSSNPNIVIDDSTTINLKNNFILINEASGAYVGNRLLKKRFLGDDIGIYSYLVKYEQKFYRFVFMFYNNSKSVKLYKFLFDDSIDDELEGSLRFYLNN